MSITFKANKKSLRKVNEEENPSMANESQTGTS